MDEIKRGEAMSEDYEALNFDTEMPQSAFREAMLYLKVAAAVGIFMVMYFGVMFAQMYFG